MSERTRQQRIITELAEEIGVRPATSTAEARAAAVVAAHMRQAGLEVGVQTFSAAAAPTAGLGVLGALGILAALIGYLFPLPSMLLTSVLLFITVRELRGSPTFAALLRRRPSQNVIGNRAALRNPKQRIVLLCHLDSPRVYGRWRTSLRLSLISVPLSLILLLIVLMASIWFTWLKIGVIIPALMLLIFVIVVLLREVRGAWSNGAVDAAAVAAAITAARQTYATDYTELWVVALGAGAAGGSGLQALLEHYPFPTEQTWFINLPWLGRGNLTLVTGEGLWRERQPDAEFLHMFHDLQSTTTHLVEQKYRGDRLDSARLLATGYHAVSLVGLRPNGDAAGFRAHDDTVAMLSDEQVMLAIRVLMRAIHHFETES